MPPYRYVNRSKLRGGNYGPLMMFGGTTLLGSVKAESLRLQGNLDGNYPLTVGNLRASGSIRIPTLRCMYATFNGDSNIRCMLEVSKILAVYGRFIGEGSVICPDVRLDGNIVYNGGITAVEITAKGELALGKLEAGDMRIEFSDRGRCSKIDGKRIIISRKQLSVIQQLFMPTQASRTALFTVTAGIKGEMVSLEHVVADYVIGNDVNIGPGCQINKVFYRDHIYIDEAAYVGWYEPLPDDPGTSGDGGAAQ